MTPEFRSHYIAYFDVLGCKAYFEGGGDAERLFDLIMDLTARATEERSGEALGPFGIAAVIFLIMFRPNQKIFSYEKVIRKHLWLLMHFEKYCLNTYGGIPVIMKGADRIVYLRTPFLNSQLCRFELRVFSCKYCLDKQEKMNSDNEAELTRSPYRSFRFRTLRDMR